MDILLLISWVAYQLPIFRCTNVHPWRLGTPFIDDVMRHNTLIKLVTKGKYHKYSAIRTHQFFFLCPKCTLFSSWSWFTCKNGGLQKCSISILIATLSPNYWVGIQILNAKLPEPSFTVPVFRVSHHTRLLSLLFRPWPVNWWFFKKWYE